MRENLDNAPEKQLAYKDRLMTLSDADLYEECGKKIWLSAYANNNPISCYHWQCDATCDECTRRGKTEIYKNAHAAEMRAAGYCDCHAA